MASRLHLTCLTNWPISHGPQMRAIIEDETMDGLSSTSASRLLADYQLATTGTDFDFRPPGRISPFFDCANAAGAHAYQRHLNSYMPWKYGDREDEQYHA